MFVAGDISDCEDEYTMLGIKSLVAKDEQDSHMSIGGNGDDRDQFNFMSMNMTLKQRHAMQSNRRHAESVARTILSHLDATYGKVNRIVCEDDSTEMPVNITSTGSARSSSAAGFSNRGGGGAVTAGSPWGNNNNNNDDCSSQDRARLRLWFFSSSPVSI